MWGCVWHCVIPLIWLSEDRCWAVLWIVSSPRCLVLGLDRLTQHQVCPARPAVQPHDAAPPTSHSKRLSFHDSQAHLRVWLLMLPGLNSFLLLLFVSLRPPRSCNGGLVSGSATLGSDHDVPGWRILPPRLCWAAEEADSGTHWMRSHSPTLGLFGTERLVIDLPLFVAALSAVKSFPTGKDDYVLLLCLYSTLAVSCDQSFQSSLVVMPTEHQRQSMLLWKMGCLYFTNRQVRPECKLLIYCYTCIQLFQCFHHNFKIISHILWSELQMTSVQSLYCLFNLRPIPHHGSKKCTHHFQYQVFVISTSYLRIKSQTFYKYNVTFSLCNRNKEQIYQRKNSEKSKVAITWFVQHCKLTLLWSCTVFRQAKKD